MEWAHCWHSVVSQAGDTVLQPLWNSHFNTINPRSGQQMLTHLAVIARQLTVLELTESGPRAHVSRRAAYSSVISAWVTVRQKVTKSAHWLKGYLKWVKVRLNSIWWTWMPCPFPLGLMTSSFRSSLSNPCPISPWDSEEVCNIYLVQFIHYWWSYVADTSLVCVTSFALVHL